VVSCWKATAKANKELSFKTFFAKLTPLQKTLRAQRKTKFQRKSFYGQEQLLFMHSGASSVFIQYKKFA
jgi:hypothetical protein